MTALEIITIGLCLVVLPLCRFALRGKKPAGNDRFLEKLNRQYRVKWWQFRRKA